MNGLGHPYVAYKVTKRMNPWLVTGSLLPDLVPFVVHERELFEPLHEGGEKLLPIQEKEAPEARDLAVGMIAHGVKYGADGFNRTIDQWLLTGKEDLREEIAQEIVKCSKVSPKVARAYRMHNYLWAGLDVFLLKNERRFVDQLAATHRGVDATKTAGYLAGYLQRESNEVERWVKRFFSCFSPKALTSMAGLVDIWQKVMAGLPEKDRVDKEKTIKLFGKIYIMFEDQWQVVLDRVINSVSLNMKVFIEK